MKLIFLYIAISSSVFLGCSQINHNKRIPASLVDDVGVVGPNGGVIIFHKENEHIIVKNCEVNTQLGLKPSEARSNCMGKVNKIPIDSFKLALRNGISKNLINNLRPITPEEIEAYKSVNSSVPLEDMETELEKINRFIQTYGSENADLFRRGELTKSISSVKARENAIKKINTEIEKVIEQIVDDSKLTLTKYSTDKDKFLYTILKNYDPSKIYPCGLVGSIDERVLDCSNQTDSQKEGFILVTRKNDFSEVYRELTTGLLWGDELPSQASYLFAAKSCETYASDDSTLSKLSWRLPTKEEFEAAEKNGIRKDLPNMDSLFWTSSSFSTHSTLGWVFSYYGYNVMSGRSRSGLSARCVAK